jgi:hypothetical protein
MKKAKTKREAFSRMPKQINQKDGREMWFYEEAHGLTVCGDGIAVNQHIQIPWRQLIKSAERYQAIKKQKSRPER